MASSGKKFKTLTPPSVEEFLRVCARVRQQTEELCLRPLTENSQPILDPDGNRIVFIQTIQEKRREVKRTTAESKPYTKQPKRKQKHTTEKNLFNIDEQDMFEAIQNTLQGRSIEENKNAVIEHVRWTLHLLQSELEDRIMFGFEITNREEKDMFLGVLARYALTLGMSVDIDPKYKLPAPKRFTSTAIHTREWLATFKQEKSEENFLFIYETYKVRFDLLNSLKDKSTAALSEENPHPDRPKINTKYTEVKRNLERLDRSTTERLKQIRATFYCRKLEEQRKEPSKTPQTPSALQNKRASHSGVRAATPSRIRRESSGHTRISTMLGQSLRRLTLHEGDDEESTPPPRHRTVKSDSVVGDDSENSQSRVSTVSSIYSVATSQVEPLSLQIPCTEINLPETLRALLEASFDDKLTLSYFVDSLAFINARKAAARSTSSTPKAHDESKEKNHPGSEDNDPTIIKALISLIEGDTARRGYPLYSLGATLHFQIEQVTKLLGKKISPGNNSSKPSKLIAKCNAIINNFLIALKKIVAAYHDSLDEIVDFLDDRSFIETAVQRLTISSELSQRDKNFIHAIGRFFEFKKVSKTSDVDGPIYTLNKQYHDECVKCIQDLQALVSRSTTFKPSLKERLQRETKKKSSGSSSRDVSINSQSHNSDSPTDTELSHVRSTDDAMDQVDKSPSPLRDSPTDKSKKAFSEYKKPERSTSMTGDEAKSVSQQEYEYILLLRGTVQSQSDYKFTPQDDAAVSIVTPKREPFRKLSAYFTGSQSLVDKKNTKSGKPSRRKSIGILEPSARVDQLKKLSGNPSELKGELIHHELYDQKTAVTRLTMDSKSCLIRGNQSDIGAVIIDKTIICILNTALLTAEDVENINAVKANPKPEKIFATWDSEKGKFLDNAGKDFVFKSSPSMKLVTLFCRERYILIQNDRGAFSWKKSEDFRVTTEEIRAKAQQASPETLEESLYPLLIEARCRPQDLSASEAAVERYRQWIWNHPSKDKFMFLSTPSASSIWENMQIPPKSRRFFNRAGRQSMPANMGSQIAPPSPGSQH